MPNGSWRNMLVEDDFTGNTDPVTNTAVPRTVGNGSFRVVGQGIAEVDSGAPTLDVDGLGGVVQLTTTDEANHCCGIETSVMYDVALMGSLIAEARIRYPVTTNKTVFMGFTDIAIANYVPAISVDILSGSGQTLTLVASDYCGFFTSTGLTDSTEFHSVYNGGVTAGVTASRSGETDMGLNASAGDWVVLRLVIRPSGDALWWIDDSLRNSVPAAVSTSVDLKFFLGVEALSAAVQTLDVDYCRIWSQRDWTA